MLKKFPEGHTFGGPYRRDMYGVEDLLKEPNTPISIITRDVRTWLVSFNRLKMAMEKKMSPTFDFNILQEKLKFFDKVSMVKFSKWCIQYKRFQDGSGLITFSNFLEVMRCNEIFFNIKNVQALMEYLGIITEDRIDYRKFLEVLKGHLSLEKMGKHFIIY